MIPCIMNIVSYTNIICIILLYDTPHYEQPKAGSKEIEPSAAKNFHVHERNNIFFCKEIFF
jgi:hypothetical protein